MYSEPFSSDDLLSGETGDLGDCQVLARVLVLELSVLLARPPPVCHIKQNKQNKTFPGPSPLTRSDNTLAQHVTMLCYSVQWYRHLQAGTGMTVSIKSK